LGLAKEAVPAKAGGILNEYKDRHKRSCVGHVSPGMVLPKRGGSSMPALMIVGSAP
jgi:hypothetical protein